MGKLVLVVNSENCSNCPCKVIGEGEVATVTCAAVRNDYGRKKFICNYSEYTKHNTYNEAGKCVGNNFPRPEWCPLKELEYKPPVDYSNCVDMDAVLGAEQEEYYVLGYNDCIADIFEEQNPLG